MTDITSAAVASLLRNSASQDATDLDTTLPNVMLDQEELLKLDVGFSDIESDGTKHSCFNSHFINVLYTGHRN